ncbi:MAG: protein kinase, partial [Eggerthellaceae bacterium]|nr:protein kinase [Eggerthellaceae bacterium]
MIGKVFDNRYRLTDRIGVGGMAEVYRAHDEVLGRTVAVKTMLPQYATDPSFAQRFKQEAAAAANLQSPYIVNVYDWGTEEDVSYIVMEYIRGSDLKSAINERGAISQRKVAEIGAQVCQALTVAHNLDIIHRDIKPQNIMIQPDGNIKVMDFGIARAKNSVMTQTPSVLGTAHYISPEQAQGKDLTPTSDIYSLGVVLYEAVTGFLPFDGPDAVSVAMQQVSQLAIPPHEYNSHIDPGLEDIIMKALEKKSSDRFTTANDMRLALNDFLAGRIVDLGMGYSHADTS